MDGGGGGVLDGAPLLWLLLVCLVATAFVALPTWFAARVVRDRRRRRTWTPTTARLLGTQVRSRGSGERRRTVLLGRWAYRDAGGVERTGSGDLTGVWVPRQGEPQEIGVLVDPADPARSVAHATRDSAVALGCVAVVMTLFFLVGAAILVVAGSTALEVLSR